MLALLGLILASFGLAYIPVIAAAIVILLGLLQMESVSRWVEGVVGSLYKHMDKQWQDLADGAGRHWKRHWGQRWIVATILLFVTVSGFVLHDFVLPRVLPRPHPAPAPTPVPVYTTRLPSGAFIGLSSGLVNFDTRDRIDGHLKEEAAQALVANAPNASKVAKGYWNLAMREDETDGEACIYLADQNVVDVSSKEYVTIVVVARLTGRDKNAVDTNAINVGRSILQGACVAQKEYNSQRKLPNGLPVRLQIANIDDPASNGEAVAKLIEQMAANDPTIVGVMGQLAGADDLVQELNKVGMPMLSSTTLYSSMPIPSLYSVAPSLQREAQIAAAAAIKISPQVGLLYDPADAYSTSLDTNFKHQFITAGGAIADENTYTIGLAPETLPDRVARIMSISPRPKLIFLAGYPQDAGFLVSYLHDMRNRWPDVRVMGGDVLYQYVHSSDARANFEGLLFTSFAFHDQWQGRLANKPAFFNEYGDSFDAQKQHSGNPFTYRVPDSDAILAYDTAGVFLQASKNAMTKQPKQSLTFKMVRQAIQSGATFSGISGPIAFGSDGEPQDKAVVLLQPGPGGIELMDVQGRYP
jgi:ABC-type branched-subunit amino acid transport system substrate-binding protein